MTNSRSMRAPATKMLLMAKFLRPFARHRRPPGRRLMPADAPYLFIIIEQVARATAQPTPDEVYLLGDARAFVTHRGGLMGFGRRRVMGVGLPLIQGLSPAELRLLIAREFCQGGTIDTAPVRPLKTTCPSLGLSGVAMDVASAQSKTA